MQRGALKKRGELELAQQGCSGSFWKSNSGGVGECVLKCHGGMFGFRRHGHAGGLQGRHRGFSALHRRIS